MGPKRKRTSEIGEEEAALEADAAAYAEEGDEDDDEDDEIDEAELEAMKKRLKEMEDESNKLKAMQEKVENEMNGASVGAPGGATEAAAAAEREEADRRSVFVGEVDYSTTPEELQQHFQACGTVNRVTILVNKMTGQPRGCAYVEFMEAESVPNAKLLDETEFKGRQIKVSEKRTNVAGMGRGRGRGRGRGGFGRGGYPGGMGWYPPPPPYGYNPYGYGGYPMAPYRGRGAPRGGPRGGLRGRGGRGRGRGGEGENGGGNGGGDE